MNVQRSLVAVVYGLVFLAFLPLAVSAEIGLWLPLGFLTALVGSLLRDPHAVAPRPLTARLWTGGLVAAFATLVAWSISDGRWLVHAITFALLMTMSRFFQRRHAKDYLQLLALSFILLLVSAVVYPGPTFALCFLGYTVLTMWGLALLHVSREIEIQTHTGPEDLLPLPLPPTRRWLGLRRALPPTQVPVTWPELPLSESMLAWRTRRLITGRWFAATSLLSLAVLTISALFFFLFPRLGMGFFFAQTRGAQAVIGFGTDAELGHFGQLKSSAEVVARVTFPDDPRRLEQPLRLRGIAFQHFAGTGWTRPAESAWELMHDAGKYRIPTTQLADPDRERIWRAEIYLEPLGQDTRVLFAPPQTQTVELLDVRFDYLRGRRRRVSLTPSGDLSYKAPPDTAMHYAVEVVEPLDPEEEERLLRDSEGNLPERIASHWTDVPPDLDPRIAKLARQLVGKKTRRYEQVRAIEEGLRAGWTYSLAGDQDAKKPLEDFLFGKKSGHCEYFATSMALMLRTLGHAARPVHGFAGGQLNPYGKYRMVRQGDAHAWVEVFFPGVGWRTFDPTPPSGQVAPPDEGMTAWARQVLDQATLVWYQWVVEYDLERQVEVVKAISSAFKSLQGTSHNQGFGSSDDKPAVKGDGKPSRVPWPVLGVTAVLAAGAWWWLRRRQDPRKRLDPQLEAAARRLERSLARRGEARQPWETWALVAARLHATDPQAGTLLGRFASAWDHARFARNPGSGERKAVALLADETIQHLKRKRAA
jgi:transglutaminase-like putative cysteine protease